MTRAVLLGGLALALAVPNALIVHKERLLAAGTPILLELAPIDPRSLIQGDYMVLDYAISRGVQPAAFPDDGLLVLRVDERNVATFERLHAPELALREGERLLRYRVRGGRLRLGAEAFFFQEGHADLYSGARFGELRVAPSGASVLVGLRDEKLAPLGPPR